MNPGEPYEALYYPFHLCHPRTLERLLDRYQVVHFRDYMALRLTPLFGTTAFSDRMGDAYPDLVSRGRIIQGYSVSGPLNTEAVASMDRDLADATWRALFHEAFKSDRRFQRGLFDPAHGMQVGRTLVPGPAALLRLMESSFERLPYSVERVKRLSATGLSLDEAYELEYGFALIKTSASLMYTVRLATQRHLSVVTDSDPHFRLLDRSCAQSKVRLANEVLFRQGY